MARIILKNDDKDTISWKLPVPKVHFNDSLVVGENNLLVVFNEGQRYPVSIGERTLGSIISDNRVQQKVLGGLQRVDAKLYGIKMNTLFQGFWGLSVVNDMTPSNPEMKIRARGDIQYEVRSFDNLIDYFKVTTKDVLTATEVNEIIRDSLQEVIKQEVYQFMHQKGLDVMTKNPSLLVNPMIEKANEKLLKMGIKIVRLMIIELKEVASV